MTEAMTEAKALAVLDRLLFFEYEIKQAEAFYQLRPRDEKNLTRLAAALFESSKYQSKPEAIKMRKDAISKLDKVLSINPDSHQTLWYLGNVYQSLGILYYGGKTSDVYFHKALTSFIQALEKDPKNELYSSSIKTCVGTRDKTNKVPKPQMENEPPGQQPKAAKKQKSSNLIMYGWVILAVGIIWMAKSRVLPLLLLVLGVHE